MINLKGGDSLKKEEYSLKSSLQVGEFKPKMLKFFHLMLLVHIVYVEYPLYSIFMSQCYCFVNTVLKPLTKI